MSITCNIYEVMLALGMEPTFKKQYEHRFGKKGSLSVNLKTNQWYGFEKQLGGGMTRWRWADVLEWEKSLKAE